MALRREKKHKKKTRPPGHGTTSLQEVRERATADPTDVRARMSLARMLVEAGQLAEATTAYVWLWEHMLEHVPSMVGVRHSFLVSELAELVSNHAPARDAFARLREAAAPAPGVRPGGRDLSDWLALNRILGDDAASLAWFDSVRDQAILDENLVDRLESDIAPLLEAAGRWADMASLYPTPLAALAWAAELRTTRRKPMEDPEALAHWIEYTDRNLRETAARLVRALTAAGRTEEATAIRNEARRLDASVEMEAAVTEAPPDEPTR